MEKNPNKSYGLRKQLNAINANTADCNIIQRALQLNYDFALTISECHGICQLVPATKHVVLTSQPNCFILLQPHDINLDLSLSENTCYIKQGSDQWHSVCNKVRVTGSTVGKAIGLDTLSSQKVHHSVFVLKKTPPVPTPDVVEKLRYGSRNTVHALVTLVGALIPALLPPCHSFFEVGTLLSDLLSRENFLAVSPDRFIQCKVVVRTASTIMDTIIEELLLKPNAHSQIWTFQKSPTTRSQPDMCLKC